jgi:16S rRNA (guanine(1405)-N(7))-methyltransferase
VTSPEDLDALVEAVRSGGRYRAIGEELVRQVGAQELAKGRRLKEAVKETRSRLHQVGGAYQEDPIDYPAWTAELDRLPSDLHDPEVQSFCKRMLAQHASTRERLPAVEHFFVDALASIVPVGSILDVACGLNFLALPWIPLAPGGQYTGWDIYTDLVEFGNRFLAHFQISGGMNVCNVAGGALLPHAQVDLALVLKTIPCLEQLDKSIGPRLLESLPARSLLVSFPSRSLGGRSKGMAQNYEAHFMQLAAGKAWEIRKFEFTGEVAFLVRKE